MGASKVLGSACSVATPGWESDCWVSWLVVGAAGVVGGCFGGGAGEALVGVALDFLVWMGMVWW